MAVRGRQFVRRLQHLGTATLVVGFTGAVVASRVLPRQAADPMDESRRLMRQAQQDIAAARAIAADPASGAGVRQIDEALSEIARITAVADREALRTVDPEVCLSAQAAVVFLSTGPVYDGGGQGSITLDISGNLGAQQFTFASGTSQTNLIEAINTFKTALGIHAAQSDVDQHRVSISSMRMDSDAFVRIREVDGPSWDMIFASATSMFPLDDWTNFGRNAITLSAWRP